MKDFLLNSKVAKRFYWTTLNGAMGLLVAYLTLLAADIPLVAAMVLPIATALSQTLTKHLNG